MTEKQRILICDDEPLIRSVLKETLLEAGYAVKTVSNGTKCLKAIENHHFDALILDLKMPETDGITVLRELNAQDSTLPVLVISAISEMKDSVERVELRIGAFLQKPFKAPEVIATLKAAILEADEDEESGTTMWG